jgi:hypothetical protein
MKSHTFYSNYSSNPNRNRDTQVVYIGKVGSAYRDIFTAPFLRHPMWNDHIDAQGNLIMPKGYMTREHFEKRYSPTKWEDLPFLGASITHHEWKLTWD